MYIVGGKKARQLRDEGVVMAERNTTDFLCGDRVCSESISFNVKAILSGAKLTQILRRPTLFRIRVPH